MNTAANARLALLALSVALFAVVWSSDQKHRSNAAASSMDGSSGHVDSADSSAAVAETPVSIDTDDVPLPAALKPGFYRIVGTGGAVRTARFTSDDLLYLGVAITSDSRDVPMTEGELQRWYFIRLDDEVQDDSGVTTASRADAPLCRVTKLLLAWAGESAGGDLQFLAGQCEDSMARALRQWDELARATADDLGIPISFASDRTAETASGADAPFCRATKLLIAWASERGAEDVRSLAGRCDGYVAGAFRHWQELARSAAEDLRQALGRVYRPTRISSGPRDDQRL